MTTAIYPGSFDPITNGHIDIATRAASLFDEIIISIYDIPMKNLLFSTEERVNLAKEALEHIPNVRVESYSGLTVKFVKEVNAQVIIRGLRMISDFEREFEMALMNKLLDHDIELVCLMSSLRYQFLSSSLLKEACQLGGDIDILVPRNVLNALLDKFNLPMK